MLLLLLLQKMVMLAVLAVLAVVLTLVMFVVISVVESISVCVVSLEAFVAPLHQLLDHVGSEDWTVVVGGWHGAKFFFLSSSRTCCKDDRSVGCDCSAGSSMFMARCCCVSGRCSCHPSRSMIRG